MVPQPYEKWTQKNITKSGSKNFQPCFFVASKEATKSPNGKKWIISQKGEEEFGA